MKVQISDSRPGHQRRALFCIEGICVELRIMMCKDMVRIHGNMSVDSVALVVVFWFAACFFRLKSVTDK